MFDLDRYNEIRRDLGLKLPIKLIFSEAKKPKFAGMYMPIRNNKGKLTSHKITIYLNCAAGRSIDTLIAHELIHAWQDENGHTEIHGKHFRKYARILHEDYGIEHIYLKGTDLE